MFEIITNPVVNYICFVYLFQHEDKQKAMLEFARVCAGMQTLGFCDAEMKVIWSVLAAIYHLGTAGAVKGTVHIRCLIIITALSKSMQY
jgi:hypothetical protein